MALLSVPTAVPLASVSNDRTLKLWDVTRALEVTTLEGYVGRVDDVAFSPDPARDTSRLAAIAVPSGSWIWRRAWKSWPCAAIRLPSRTWTIAPIPAVGQIASSSEDQTVKVWDTSTGREIVTLRGHSDRVYCVAYSPDGRQIASGGADRILKVWDVATGRERLTLRGHSGPVEDVAFSPDGGRIASAGRDSTVRLWDASTGQELFTLRGHSSLVTDVAFSADGRSIASASGDRTVRLWDATTGEEKLVLRGHSAGVLGVSFSPDGGRIVSAGDDLTVRLWDVITGQEVLTLRGHTDQIMSVSFSSDGGRIATASWDGTVKLWDATTLSPEMEALREARGVVETLFAKPLPEAEVLARIRSDPTLSDQVRQSVLVLAERFGRSLVVHEAERLIDSLFGRPMLREDVVAYLNATTTIGEAVRREALALVESVPEDATTLNWHSWVCSSRGEPMRPSIALPCGERKPRAGSSRTMAAFSIPLAWRSTDWGCSRRPSRLSQEPIR